MTRSWRSPRRWTVRRCRLHSSGFAGCARRSSRSTTGWSATRRRWVRRGSTAIRDRARNRPRWRSSDSSPASDKWARSHRRTPRSARPTPATTRRIRAGACTATTAPQKRSATSLDIMDPGSVEWQRQWLARFGPLRPTRSASTGLHLDTYGHPRVAVDSLRSPEAAPMDSGIRLVHPRCVRQARPGDVLSFNQVNGVPAAAPEPPRDRPGFRYVEIWPPNDRWRHLEALMSRSAGRHSVPRGDTLAIYPPVRGAASARAALRTVVLSEAIATALGIGTLIFGDAGAAFRHPYYVEHERLDPAEQVRTGAAAGIALGCVAGDLFRRGLEEHELVRASTTRMRPGQGELGGDCSGDARSRKAGSCSVVVRHTARTRCRRGQRDRPVGSSVEGSVVLAATEPGVCMQADGRGARVESRPSAGARRRRFWGATATRGFVPSRDLPSRCRIGRDGRWRASVPLVDGWSVLRLEPNGKR